MSINTTGYWALVMRALMETGDIASVYTQMENPDNFYIGYIMHMTARHFTMRVMDIDGSHDGWLTGRCADVKQVIAGDDYEVRMKWLETLLDTPAPVDPLTHECKDLFSGYARAAMEKGEVITIWLDGVDEEMSGFVKSVDDLHITLRALDFFGQDADERVINLAQIELMSMDALEERMIMRMHSNISPNSPLKLL